MFLHRDKIISLFMVSSFQQYSLSHYQTKTRFVLINLLLANVALVLKFQSCIYEDRKDEVQVQRREGQHQQHIQQDFSFSFSLSSSQLCNICTFKSQPLYHHSFFSSSLSLSFLIALLPFFLLVGHSFQSLTGIDGICVVLPR